MLQGVVEVTKITKHLDEVTLKLQELQSLRQKNMRAVQATAAGIDVNSKVCGLGPRAVCDRP